MSTDETNLSAAKARTILSAKEAGALLRISAPRAHLPAKNAGTILRAAETDLSGKNWSAERREF